MTCTYFKVSEVSTRVSHMLILSSPQVQWTIGEFYVWVGIYSPPNPIDSWQLTKSNAELKQLKTDKTR